MPNAHTTRRQLQLKAEKDEARYTKLLWGNRPTKAQILHLLRENGSLKLRAETAEKKLEELSRMYTLMQGGK